MTGFLLGFVGHGSDETESRSFEDEVLALLPDHGAKVLFRGRRTEGQSDSLPLEMHVLWFPSRLAFDGYLSDPRRSALLGKYGEVFTAKQAVELTPVTMSFTD